MYSIHLVLGTLRVLVNAERNFGVQKMAGICSTSWRLFSVELRVVSVCLCFLIGLLVNLFVCCSVSKICSSRPTSTLYGQFAYYMFDSLWWNTQREKWNQHKCVVTYSARAHARTHTLTQYLANSWCRVCINITLQDCSSTITCSREESNLGD